MRETFTRRRVVAGTTGLIAALAGCGGESPADEDGPTDSATGGGGTPTPQQTPTVTATPQAVNADLADQTSVVARNVVWHATEYDDTMRQIRILANRVVGVVSDLRGSDSVTTAELTRLEDATTAMAEFVRQNVQPYYPVSDTVANGNNRFVQQVKLASERGDTGALDTELQRTGTFYRNYTRRAFAETQFPNDVVHERLYDLMTRDDSTNVLFGLFHPGGDYVAVSHEDRTDDIKTDGVPQHFHEFDTGHVVATIVHEHDEGTHTTSNHQSESVSGRVEPDGRRVEPVDRRVYAYNRETGRVDILADTEPDKPRMESNVANIDPYVPEQTDIFGPVRVDDANDEFYVEFGYAEDPDEEASPFASSLVGQFQTFSTPGAAQDAVEDLLAGAVFEQGTGRIIDDRADARDWRQVFYTNDGTTLYAYMLAVGRVVVTLAPSRDEWDARADWPGPIAESWLGDPTPLDT